ncbi:MAG: GNAT family N-acetyltransferase [Thermoplasmata archaeon]|nr:GNAT family N-acetyltransferase [Thermoplasmata archaeon]
MSALNTGSIDMRLISPDEIEQMISLWHEAGLPSKPGGRDTVESLREQLANDPDLFIGAFDRERMIGAIIGSDDGRKGWVNRLAVVPDKRRSGVASRLLERCEEALRRRGRQIICTLIENDNDYSERLFTSKGYKRENEIIYYAKRDADDI